jgi:protein involved in polysaccharide export with SLBB domain
MRKTALISLVFASIAFSGISTAQVSRFPAPPSLAPPPDHNSGQSQNNQQNMPNPIPMTSSVGGPANSTPSSDQQNGTSEVHPAVPLTASTLTSMDALNDKIPLHVGDTISFRVIEDRDEAATRVVTDTGEIDFPYVGRLKVQDKTCHQVALELKRLLEVDYYKQATVIVGLDIIANQEREKKLDFVWVIGEVRGEGPQQLSKIQPLTVSQIILRAGGFGTYADERKVRLIHRSALSPEAASTPPDIGNLKDGQTIDVKAIFEGHPGEDPVVAPDDYIIVPKRILNL